MCLPAAGGAATLSHRQGQPPAAGEDFWGHEKPGADGQQKWPHTAQVSPQVRLGTCHTCHLSQKPACLLSFNLPHLDSPKPITLGCTPIERKLSSVLVGFPRFLRAHQRLVIISFQYQFIIKTVFLPGPLSMTEPSHFLQCPAYVLTTLGNLGENH